MATESILFKPYKLNSHITLKNKIVMAPMTRVNADKHFIPTNAMINYYTRRADSGLIITEGTIIRLDGTGYPNVPGIFNAAQIEKWKLVTKSVHQKEGLIFLQIWHVGRVSHPDLLNGELPISSSKTIMKNIVARSPHLTYGESRAATIDEIKALIEAYRNAALNAIEAGFDGIEIHGANGYLIDQFLHYHTNLRTDEYGGSPENMARFALEIVKACGDAIGYENVGLRLSPGAYLNEMVGDKRDASVFEYLLKALTHLSIAYVHTGNFNDSQRFAELNDITMTAFIRKHYRGTLIASGGYSIQSASEKIAKNEFDLIAIGRPFIANHDLISKIKENKPFIEYDRSMLETLY